MVQDSCSINMLTQKTINDQLKYWGIFYIKEEKSCNCNRKLTLNKRFYLIRICFLNFTYILYRQVRNTTCLELARPSNQQFRLSCNNIGTYHCLLDQNYTNEFEICKMWKWIPKGNCCQLFYFSKCRIIHALIWNVW